MRDKKTLVKWDKEHIWHPFTQMKEWEDDSEIIVIERAQGSYLFDLDGNRYLDAVSSLWVNLHGHKNETLNRAVAEQLSKVAHSTLLGLSNVPSIVFAKRLVELLPKKLTKVFYSDNGSTAVEVAIKMAYLFWQYSKSERREIFVKFDGSYHGDTLGSVSVGGIKIFHEKFGKLCFKTLEAPYPFCYRCPKNLDKSSCQRECYLEFEKIVKQNSKRIAAVVIEPLVQCASGIRVAPQGFLKFVESTCKRYEIPLIVDEVATGFGRTGKMFAIEHEEVEPDFVALAKGISGGYLPLAVTVTTKDVYDAFLGRYEEFKTFFHGHTYTGNPLACASAIASLDIFKKEKVLENLPKKIEALSRGLEKFWQLPITGDIRQVGLIAGVELVKNKKSKEPFEPKHKVALRICKRARKYGVISRPLGDVLVFFPPLCCSTNEIAKICDAMFKATKDILKELKNSGII